MEGLSTRPVFDVNYWHVGEVVKITIEPLAKQKLAYWQTMPTTKFFYGIIVDVLMDKLIICYYTKKSRKLVGKYSIPIERVVDSSIIVKKVGEVQ